MIPTDSPTYPDSELEALINALHGVLATRVVVSGSGDVEEVHVLADEQLHPKQIVRNIESALSAGLGLIVDRRVVSVAQVRGEEAAQLRSDAAQQQTTATPSPASAPDQSPVSSPESSPAGSPASPPASSRYAYLGHDARTRPDVEASCRVSIRRGNDVISGTGTGPSTQIGRAQAAARAVFAAIAVSRRDHVLGFESATLVESHGRSYVLVAAHASVGRDSMPLTGIAALHRSPEEAAILAAMQATNRWAELDD